MCVCVSGETYLQLLEGEAAALTEAAVVLDGRASHDGAELIDGAGGDGGGLGPAGFPAPGLRAGLHTTVRQKNTIPKSRFNSNPICSQGYSSSRRFRTWSKWVRTRRCQSFRRSILDQFMSPQNAKTHTQRRGRDPYGC